MRGAVGRLLVHPPLASLTDESVAISRLGSQPATRSSHD